MFLLWLPLYFNPDYTDGRFFKTATMSFQTLFFLLVALDIILLLIYLIRKNKITLYACSMLFFILIGFLIYLSPAYFSVSPSKKTISSQQEAIGNLSAWREVRIDSVEVNVPYSPHPGSGNVYEAEQDQDFLSLKFGDYVNENSNVINTRQYNLQIYDTKPQGLSLDEINVNACPDDIDDNGKVIQKLTPPKKVTAGGVSGVSYSVGAWGECSTFFSFKIGDHYFSLGKTYPFGSYDPTHTITPDMEKIIQGVRVL